MKVLLHRSTYRILFWIWTLAIMVLSFMPDISAIDNQKAGRHLEIRIDYVIHLLMFTILALLFMLWRLPKRTEIYYRESVLSLLSLLVYSSVIEVIQIWIPGRTFNIVDLLYNCAGIGLGAILAYTILKALRFEEKMLNTINKSDQSG